MLKNGFLLSLVGAFLTACQLDPECTWVDSYAEFEDYNLIEGLEPTSLLLLGPDFDKDIEPYTGYVVRTDSAYEELLRFSKEDSCTECVYPDIDFSEFTLVGFPMEISCLANNYIKITSTPMGNLYAIKTLDFTECNSIWCGNFSFNWVLLPKSADTATITFENGLARNDCDC